MKSVFFFLVNFLIKNAFLIIKDDVIIDFGSMNTLGIKKSDKVIDLTGKLVLPTWCDSHTHLVFADTREEEFVNRIKGLTYQEIAEKAVYRDKNRDIASYIRCIGVSRYH